MDFLMDLEVMDSFDRINLMIDSCCFSYDVTLALFLDVKLTIFVIECQAKDSSRHKECAPDSSAIV